MAGTTVTNVLAEFSQSPPSVVELMRQTSNLDIDDGEQIRLWISNLLAPSSAVPGISVATTTTKARNTATITYSIDGKPGFTKASTDNLWTLGVAGSNTLVAASSFQIYLLMLDSAGAATVIEGTQASTLAGVVLPRPLSSSKSIVGSVQIATAAGTFTPGTTALATAGAVTCTFVDGFALRAADMQSYKVTPHF